jgi:small GTP-binding protein
VALDRILTETESALLGEERRLLGEAQTTLARCDTPGDDLATLAESIAQLDQLFLLVVVGEFNAGKSAFINALLGAQLLEEGVTPTTTRIHIIRHGDEVTRQRLDDATEELTSPARVLEDATIVDTPGTNALDRRHEAITSEFVPRSDLVIFVTSADRPYSESERAFLERIRRWGKKVVVVVNKIDILRRPGEVDQVTGYIADHSRRLLAMDPPIFPISSLRASEAQAAGDVEAWRTSGLPAVESYLHDTLDDAERLALKLGNPLGVAAHLVAEAERRTAEAIGLLADDIKTLDDIERQLAAYAEDVDREFRYRLADIDNLLLAMDKRGTAFFDDRLRLRRLPELVKSDRFREDFEREVVADTPQRIEAKVDDLIDWLIASDLEQWQAVVQHVSRRRTAHAERIVGDATGRLQIDRNRLLETIGRAARDSVARYDRRAEAQRIADGVQKAVASTALMEAGAIGLGATVALLATSSAVDATGLLAAGTLATLGLFILPQRRRRAKRELGEAIATMRGQLMEKLSAEFSAEAERCRGRIHDTIAPYDRFVRAERTLLEGRRNELAELLSRIGGMRARVEDLASGAAR